MNGDCLCERLRMFGDTLFPRSFSAHFQQTGKVLWGVRIESENPGRFERLFGPISSADLAMLNEQPCSSSAGYCANPEAQFPNLTTRVEILLLHDKVLSRSPREIEAFMLHELAHWYIDSGLAKSHPLALTSDDQIAGDHMYNSIDRSARDWEDRTRHTPEFCVILAHLARTGEPLVAPGSGLLFDLVMADDIFP